MNTNHGLARAATDKLMKQGWIDPKWQNMYSESNLLRMIEDHYAAPMAELELSKVMLAELRRVDVQGETLRTLVKCAFACGEISNGRAAELLDISVQEWREEYGDIPQGDGLKETLEKLYSPRNEVAT